MLHPRKDGYADQPLYPYNPSETAALAFVAMFAIAGLLHLVFMFPYRAWFPIPMIIGSASKFAPSNVTCSRKLTRLRSGGRLLLSTVQITRQYSPNPTFHTFHAPHHGRCTDARSNNLHVTQTHCQCS